MNCDCEHKKWHEFHCVRVCARGWIRADFEGKDRMLGLLLSMCCVTNICFANLIQLLFDIRCCATATETGATITGDAVRSQNWFATSLFFHLTNVDPKLVGKS